MQNSSTKVLVTGGAGFIGSNLVNRLLGQGMQVTVYDNMSRSGTSSNMAWLAENHTDGNLHVVKGDLREADKLVDAAADVDRIYHLAGQVAVTTSVVDPRSDFEDNALGTFNVLEAARVSKRNPVVLYSSTNKVYGGMEEVKIAEYETRYMYADLPCGVPETQPLDFHSPYGCSKGAGDQYVRDYARIYNMPTIVMRQSCIYGYRQFGIEDQGWIAWFIIAALKNRPISIYGNGKQVRDALFIEDLLDGYEAAIQNLDVTSGQVYNMGGGSRNVLSIWAEFGPLLEELMGRPVPVTYADWRPGDQPVFVADIRKAAADFGWEPKIGIREGITQLYSWIEGNQHLFAHI